MAFPADWLHKKTITLDSAYNGGIVQFRVYAGTGSDAPSTKAFYLGGNAAFPDYRDIRFADSADALLTHNIRWVAKDGSFAIVQVRTNETVAADQEVSCYVGNADATDISDPADVAIFGDRFVDANNAVSNIGAYDGRIASGTHLWQRLAYKDNEFDVVTSEDIGWSTYEIFLRKYNTLSGLFSLPRRIGSSKARDYHNYGTSVIDSFGTSHVFYGCHNTPLFYNTLTSTKILGTEISLPGLTAATYPQPVITADDVIYVFYRTGDPTTGNFAYSKSTDLGATWSNPIPVFLPSSGGGCYGTVNISGAGTIHLQITVRAVAINSADSFFGINYAKMDTATDTWSKADGTAITLPGNQSTFDAVESGAGFHAASIAIHPVTDAAYLSYAKDITTGGYFTASNGVISHWNGTSWDKTTVTANSNNNYFWQLHIDSDLTYRLLTTSNATAVAEVIEYKKLDGGSWDAGTPLTSGSPAKSDYVVVSKQNGAPYLGMWSNVNSIGMTGAHAAANADPWTYIGGQDLQLARGADFYFYSDRTTTDRRAYAPITPSADWLLDFDTLTVGTPGVAVNTLFGLFTHSENYTTTVTNSASDMIAVSWYAGVYRLVVRDGTASISVGATENILAPQSNPHFCRLTKSGNSLTLGIFTDEARTSHVLNSPLTADLTGRTIGSLGYLQFSNQATPTTTDPHRVFFDNIYLTDPETATVSAFGDWDGIASSAFTAPAQSVQPVISAGTLSGAQAGALTAPSISLQPSISAGTLTGQQSATFTAPSQTVQPAVNAGTLAGAQAGSFLGPAVSVQPTLAAGTLVGNQTGNFLGPALSVQPSISAGTLQSLGNGLLTAPDVSVQPSITAGTLAGFSSGTLTAPSLSVTPSVSAGALVGNQGGNFLGPAVLLWPEIAAGVLSGVATSDGVFTAPALSVQPVVRAGALLGPGFVAEFFLPTRNKTFRV